MNSFKDLIRACNVNDEALYFEATTREALYQVPMRWHNTRAMTRSGAMDFLCTRKSEFFVLMTRLCVWPTRSKSNEIKAKRARDAPWLSNFSLCHKDRTKTVLLKRSVLREASQEKIPVTPSKTHEQPWQTKTSKLPEAKAWVSHERHNLISPAAIATLRWSGKTPPLPWQPQ